MKFYLLMILTRCGEFEFLQEKSIKVDEGVNHESAVREVVANWYDYGDEDGRVEPDSDGVAWFDNGNAVHCDRITEISKSAYEIFQKYTI